MAESKREPMRNIPSRERGSYSLLIGKEQRHLLEAAAASRQEYLSEFVRDSALARARAVLSMDSSPGQGVTSVPGRERSVYSLRLGNQERHLLEAAAAKCSRRLSEFVRGSALARARKVLGTDRVETEG
jgi:uncharacterized protein (DUF1778 family)